MTPILDNMAVYRTMVPMIGVTAVTTVRLAQTQISRTSLLMGPDKKTLLIGNRPLLK